MQSRILLALRHETFFLLEAMNAAIRRELDRLNDAPMAGGQAQDVFRLRPARNRLKTDGGEMMALVDHQMPVIGNEVVDLAPARQALDDPDIDDATGLALPAANLPDRRCGKVEKCSEPREPLFHELAAVNEHQSIDLAGGDDGCGHDGLAEAGRGCKHARLMPQQRLGGGPLFRGQFAEEGCLQRASAVALVAEVHADARLFQQPLQFLAAAARQRDMMGKQLGAGDDAGNAEGGAPHRLGAVEGGVLESGETDEAVDQTRWEAGARNVNLVAHDRFDPIRQRFCDRGQRPAP